MNFCKTCNTTVEFKRNYDTILFFMISLSGLLFLIPGFSFPIILILIPFPSILYYLTLPQSCPVCENLLEKDPEGSPSR